MNSKICRWIWIATVALATTACEGRMVQLQAEPTDEEQVESSETDETPENPTAVIEDREIELAPGRMFRLTNTQYRNSVRAVFGEEIDFDVDLPADEQSELFLSIGASKVGTSARGVELYQESALDIATQVFANIEDHDVLADCGPAGPDDPCIEESVRHYGRLLWRRPLSGDEVARFTGIVDAAGTEPDQLSLGLKYALVGLLASPNFIYVPNVGEDDPATGARRYTGMEMASRLAFFIWNSPPDDELLTAAKNGELMRKEGIEAQARRMLDDPRAHELPSRFLGQNWNVADLAVGLHDPDAFPEWNEELAEAYRREFDLVLKDIVFDREADLFEIFTGKNTFVNRRLADVYGLDVESDGWVEVGLGDSRTGLITSGAVVAANSTSEHFLPTYRGVFIMERMLCQPPPSPPADVADDVDQAMTAVETDEEPRTTREIVEQHASDPQCAGCHAAFDPMGFTYENFDRIGRYQTEQNGRPVDAVGDVFGTELEGVPELADWLAQDSRTSRCITDRLYTFATGRHALPGEDYLIGDLNEAFVTGGRNFKDLVVSIVTSPGFRFFADTTTEDTQL